MDIGKLSGRQIDEYELVLLIGKGGMSAVYRAYQEELDRHVAFKILADALTDEEDYHERFRQEAKMAASLEHPNIVPVYDYGTFDESAYVVMRLLLGGTLDERMKARHMSSDEIVTVVNAIAKALDYAHHRGIIHRDVKPGNIMFDDQGGIYLVDFGIAKAQAVDVGLTADNLVLGTPAYMAPELWQTKDITPSVDQYALAVIAYKMLAGEAPFSGNTPHQLMYQHLNDPVPPIQQFNANIPTQVNTVLKRALAKDPAQRYGSVSAFARALSDAVLMSGDKQTILSRRPGAPPQPSPSIRDTVPNIPAAKPTQPAAARPVPNPPRRAAAPPPAPRSSGETGDKTMIMRAAVGGGLGLILLLVVLAVAAFVMLNLFGGGGDDGANDSANDQTTSVIETATNTVTPAAQSNNGIQLTPIVATLSAPSVGDSQTLFNEPQTPVRDVAISSDGRFIASGHGDGLVRLWRDGANSPEILRGHSDVVNTVAFSPDGTLLASAGRDATIRLWNVADGSPRAVMTGHGGSIRDIRFNASGTLLASASEDRTVRLWDVSNGQQVRSLATGDSRALAVAFSPAGTLIAGGNEDGTIYLWDVNSGSLSFTLSGHSESVRGLDFNPNGQMLASSSTDDTVRLWDIPTRQTLHTLRGAERDVWTVTFNPTGSLVAAGDRGNNIRLWRVIDGVQVSTLTGHSGWVLGLAFSPDNQALLSASGDGTIRLWGIEG